MRHPLRRARERRPPPFLSYCAVTFSPPPRLHPTSPTALSPPSVLLPSCADTPSSPPCPDAHCSPPTRRHAGAHLRVLDRLPPPPFEHPPAHPTRRRVLAPPPPPHSLPSSPIRTSPHSSFPRATTCVKPCIVRSSIEADGACVIYIYPQNTALSKSTDCFLRESHPHTCCARTLLQFKCVLQGF